MSLRHVAIEAKFLDENKLKIHLKSKFELFKLHQSIFWVESETTISELRKRKTNFLCCVHLLRKAVPEIRKFPVKVVQQWLKNVHKNVMHLQSCCLVNNTPIAFFAILVTLPIVVGPFCCDPKILLP